MEQMVATVTSRGQVSIPARVRKKLGIRPHDKVAFTIEGDVVRLEPVRFTLEDVFGSVPAIPGTTTEDFDRQIEEAISEALDRVVPGTANE